jgi:hypothetical protein
MCRASSTYSECPQLSLYRVLFLLPFLQSSTYRAWSALPTTTSEAAQLAAEHSRLRSDSWHSTPAGAQQAACLSWSPHTSPQRAFPTAVHAARRGASQLLVGLSLPASLRINTARQLVIKILQHLLMIVLYVLKLLAVNSWEVRAGHHVAGVTGLPAASTGPVAQLAPGAGLFAAVT